MTPTMDCPVCGTRYSEGTRACPIDGHAFATAGEGAGAAGGARPPEAPATPIDWEDPSVHQAKHAFNLALLKWARRFPDPSDTSARRLQAHVEALDNYLERLALDSTPRFVQIATQAAAFSLCLAARVPNDALGTAAVDSYPLPPRYKACVREPPGVVASIESFAAFASGLFWSFLVFHPVESALASDRVAFATIVCQSLRELFYLTYPTIALKQQFLAEESFKIQNGYYPDSIRAEVEALLGRLQAVCQKGQQQIAAAPGAERNGFLALVAPLSVAQVATMSAALTMGGVNPFPFRPLSAPENAALEYVLRHGLTIAPVPLPPPLRTYADVNAVLLAMREERAANAANAIALGRGGQLLPLYVVFEESHYWLTRLCNVFGARVAGSHDYVELAPRAWQTPGMSWEKQKAVYAQADSDLAEALFPNCGTIETVLRAIKRANATPRAEQAQQANAPAATRVAADTDWRKGVEADLEVLSAPPDADFAELAVSHLRDVLAHHGMAPEALAKMNQSELAAAARSALQQP